MVIWNSRRFLLIFIWNSVHETLRQCDKNLKVETKSQSFEDNFFLFHKTGGEFAKNFWDGQTCVETFFPLSPNHIC